MATRVQRGRPSKPTAPAVHNPPRVTPGLKFIVQVDGSKDGQYCDPIVIAERALLSSAIKMMQNHSTTAYVVHPTLDLQLHEVDGRLVWIDAKGFEQLEPIE